MARKLRIEFEGARYHVINRGYRKRHLTLPAGRVRRAANLRGFPENVGVAEAVRRCGWRLHAFVLMRNRYHLALETPRANLVEGMHWFQSTMTTRFNRFRRGHLFQGRYQSIVLEDFGVLARVVDYIHLNPVRAKVVTPERVAEYRWSSLPRFLRGPRFDDMTAKDWLRTRGQWREDPADWERYHQHLIVPGADVEEQKRQGLQSMSTGWALGTNGWRRAIARD